MERGLCQISQSGTMLARRWLTEACSLLILLIMKSPRKLALAALLAAATAVNAFALSLTPANADFFFQMGGDVGADDVETITPSNVQLIEVYKQNVGGSESGAFANSYTTVFAPLTDPKGATISYDGAPDPVIGGTEIWALAKDGATGHYLWNISGWNGTEALIMSGLYPNQGSISHVSIFSNTDVPRDTPPPRVPDGGTTVALLGFALGALALMRRQFSSK